MSERSIEKTEPRSPHEHSLLDLCGEIHGSVTGSGEAIPRERAEELRMWLRWRTKIGEGWRTGPSHSAAFDKAALDLCLATLRELDEDLAAPLAGYQYSEPAEVLRGED